MSPRREVDPNTNSNIDAFVVTHSHYEWTVDFEKKIVRGYVDHDVNVVQDAPKIVLDTSALVIKSASIVSPASPGSTASSLPFSLGDTTIYGQALSIELPGAKAPASNFKLRIEYETGESTALQWLTKEQTVGKNSPYLFTQCEAIHMRSLAPTQDTPQIKCTYSASVHVPAGMTALMSAVQQGTAKEETVNGVAQSVWNWVQKIPIPVYLTALAVGNLAKADVSPRSAVWTEPEVLEAAAWEFEGTEAFLKAGEELGGEYVWGRYDLLVLPGSFPYGGMENPCLTFVTPTLLAGDRSQVDVVAHEAAHSWTGNLVTNVDWQHFWLNEGWTVFMERKIVGRVYTPADQQLSALIGLEHLKADIENMGADNEMTKLVKDLRGKDPDDAFSSVPYEKGFNFLYYLEQLLGGPEIFEPYVSFYIKRFSYKSLDTTEWKASLYEYFGNASNPGGGAPTIEKLDTQVDWDAWFFGLGMPPVDNKFDDTLAKQADVLAGRWGEAIKGEPRDAEEAKTYYEGKFSAEDLKGFSPAQKMRLLDRIGDAAPVSHVAVQAMDAAYTLTGVRNSEIRFRWELICLKSSYEPILSSTKYFLTIQGRMKYIRPLYRAVFKFQPETAKAWFTELRATYHPIAASLVAKDLGMVGGK